MTIDNAIEAFARGQMIIVTDHHDRENEGDLVIAAEFVTPEHINFMTKYGRGLVCITITNGHAEKLQLKRQDIRNANAISCAFTTSVDAACLKTSGISVKDRALTIQKIANANASPNDLSTPGHIFPVVAVTGGLKERQGHTEASIELCQRVNLFPSAVICEILSEDGSSALKKELLEFSNTHSMPILAISDLLTTL